MDLTNLNLPSFKHFPNKKIDQMDTNYFENQSFLKEDYCGKPLIKGDYENCMFTNCNFSDSDLSGIHFFKCTFNTCNISNAGMKNTSLSNIVFKDCKLLGVHFENCNKFLFIVDFENCNLNFSSFFQVNLKKRLFKNCNLQDVDFTETDLSSVYFNNCDLANANFDNTILEKANLTSAINYTIDPEKNRIKKAKFSQAGLIGLLGKYDIVIE